MLTFVAVVTGSQINTQHNRNLDVDPVYFDVRSTRPSYEYRVPLAYVETFPELEAVDTPPKKNPFSLKQGILIGLL